MSNSEPKHKYMIQKKIINNSIDSIIYNFMCINLYRKATIDFIDVLTAISFNNSDVFLDCVPPIFHK